MTMRWRRMLAAALLLTAVVGGVLVGGTAQAQVVSTGTVTISGDSHDSVTAGKSYSYSTRKGDVLEVSSETGGTVSVSVILPNGGRWDLDFDAPGSPDQPVPGQSSVLVPGTYNAARRYPFNGTSPGLSLSTAARGCNEVTGSFTVKKAVFGRQGYVQTFDATFVQHCNGLAPAARGEVRISNPPPPPPPRPTPSPASATASPKATAGPYATPTFAPTATRTGAGAVLARRGAGAPSTTVWSDAARTHFMMIGLGLIAVVILVANVVMGVRTRRMRRTFVLSQLRPAGTARMGAAVMEAGSTSGPVEHRWQQYHPSPPVARRSLPGRVIAASIVLAVRGTLGLLLTFAIIGASHLPTVPELSLPSWYTNVLWIQAGVCAGQVASGLLLGLGKQWPRLLGLSVLWFDIAAGILIMVATTFSCAGLVGIAVDAVIIWMLFWAEVQDWCY